MTLWIHLLIKIKLTPNAELDVVGAIEIVDPADRELVDRQDASVQTGDILVQFASGDPLGTAEQRVGFLKTTALSSR